MLTLVTMPTASDLFSGISTWASPMFDNLLPFAEFAMGILAGVFFISFMIYTVRTILHNRNQH